MPVNSTTKRRKRKKMSTEAERAQAGGVEDILKVEAKKDAVKEDVPQATSTPEVNSKEEVNKVKAEAPKAPAPLPKQLIDRMAAAQRVVEDVQAEVKRFKDHPDFREGNMIGTLYGLHGKENVLGGRSLNFIDEDWIFPDLHVHWANKRMVDWHRGQGYQPFDEDKFKNMITARGGSCSFGHNAENHVTVGDLVLMVTSRDHYEAREEAKREKTSGREKRAKNTLYQKGRELGVDVYEGDAGPKLEKIIDLLVNEFGEKDVRRIFLSH